ncbi:MAG: hypothetical protein H5T98_02255 [Syntrophomonadaceae bacterium]|nr:hypothetical protein [Syntrophomonadaceae bacterium]
MRLLVWYPALKVEGAEPYLFLNDKLGTAVAGSAVMDAPPDKSEAPYPLVVYSPGLTATADASVFYTQNLASHGYVVVSMDHLDANQLDLVVREGNWKNLVRFFPRMLKEFVIGNPSDTVLVMFTNHFRKTEFGLRYRPQEVRLAIDSAIEWNEDTSSPLHNLMDTDAIGLTGHSLGAWTALLLGGMTLKQYEGFYACGMDINQGCIADHDPCRTEFARSLESPHALRDERVKAILPMAPPIFHRRVSENAGEIKVPLLFLTGDDKRWEATVSRQKEVFYSAPPPKHFVFIQDTDHFVICDMLMKSRYVLNRLRPPKFKRHFHEKAQVYKDYSVAFFDLYLKGKEDAVEILRSSDRPFVRQAWCEL